MILTNQLTITIFLLQATLYIYIAKEVAGRVEIIDRSVGKPFKFVNDFGQDLPDLGPDLGPDFVPQDEPAPPPENLERQNTNINVGASADGRISPVLQNNLQTELTQGQGADR